jgi:Family of unknown function (DUF6210)
MNGSVVNLYDSIGTGLIVSWPTGISYSNQTGGYACFHPCHEGVFVPLGNDMALDPPKLLGIEDELFAYFTGPPWNCTGAISGLTIADADVIDRIMTTHPFFQGIRVNRSRLLDSQEAWVHVTIDATAMIYTAPGPYLEGFEPRPTSGVLTWCNSD